MSRVALLFKCEWRLADEALIAGRLFQVRIDADALVEYEALAIVVRVTAVLEVFEDAAVELKNLLEPLALHERPGLLATDAAGTEHDDGLLLQFVGELLHRFGELAKLVDPQQQRILECPQLHFVIVAGIEQRDGTPFVEPPLQLGRSQLG